MKYSRVLKFLNNQFYYQFSLISGKYFQGIIELQSCVRESIMLFKNLLDEVTSNMEEEKQIINTFCHGMQESIEKTHAAMAMEVQR